MASTYTPAGIELIANGEQTNSWGTTTNENWELMEELVTGGVSIALTGTTYTLTTSDGVTSDGRNVVVTFTGSPGGTCTVTISPNDMQKVYFIVNDSDETVTISQGSGATVDVSATKSKVVFCDGAGAGAAVTDVSTGFAADPVSSVPTGAVFYFAMNSVPTGYLACDGSAVSRSTYANLYTAIGDTFGAGDGSTTFNLPNLMGEFIRGFNGSGSGKDSGRVFGSQQDDAITEHNHYMARNSSGTGGTSSAGSTSVLSGYYNFAFVQSGATQEGLCGNYVEANASGACQNIAVGDVYHLDSSSSTTTEAETRPTNVSLLACIKT